MARCLDLGADSCQVKPLNQAMVREMICYTRAKYRFLTRVRQQRPRKRFKPSRSPSPERIDPVLDLTPDTCLAHGRRSAVHLGLTPGFISPAISASAGARDPGEPVAIKICSVESIRGPAPPPHPCLNPVLGRNTEQGLCIEERVLCDGELFDTLACDPDLIGGMPEAKALSWFRQILSAVVHCHANGAMHGQLRPENVLMHRGRPQLIGFYICLEPGVGGRGGEGGGEGEMERVSLRPFQSFDPPEWKGRSAAWPSELMAGDMWSLGMLLLLLTTGSSDLPPAVAARQASMLTTMEAAATRCRGTQTGGKSRRHERSSGGKAAAAAHEQPPHMTLAASAGAGPQLTHATHGERVSLSVPVPIHLSSQGTRSDTLSVSTPHETASSQTGSGGASASQSRSVDSGRGLGGGALGGGALGGVSGVTSSHDDGSSSSRGGGSAPDDSDASYDAMETGGRPAARTAAAGVRRTGSTSTSPSSSDEAIPEIEPVRAPRGGQGGGQRGGQGEPTTPEGALSAELTELLAWLLVADPAKRPSAAELAARIDEKAEAGLLRTDPEAPLDVKLVSVPTTLFAPV